MKKLAVLFYFIIVLCVLPLALRTVPVQAADSSACYNIANGDARSYCIARARHEPSTCYSIKNADMRAECLAEVS